MDASFYRRLAASGDAGARRNRIVGRGACRAADTQRPPARAAAADPHNGLICKANRRYAGAVWRRRQPPPAPLFQGLARLLLNTRFRPPAP
jgi:hypothetical protein